MIDYEIVIGGDSYREIEEHLCDLMVQARGEPKTRYVHSHMIWTTAALHTSGRKHLDLRGWSEDRLWDLWGVVPAFYKGYRKAIQKFLERSPLIKLAECAD